MGEGVAGGWCLSSWAVSLSGVRQYAFISFQKRHAALKNEAVSGQGWLFPGVQQVYHQQEAKFVARLPGDVSMGLMSIVLVEKQGLSATVFACNMGMSAKVIMGITHVDITDFG